MKPKFTLPEASTNEFLLPNGVARSVSLIEVNRNKVAGLTTPIVGFDSSHIHYLLGELIYLLQGRWNHGIPAQIDLFRSQKEKLYKGTLEDFDETILAMREIVIESGELFFSRIVSYEEGEVREDEHGGNRNFQSNLLVECILFGLRIGIDSETLTRWKAKLRERDRQEVEENITFKPKSK